MIQELGSFTPPPIISNSLPNPLGGYCHNKRLRAMSRKSLVQAFFTAWQRCFTDYCFIPETDFTTFV